jgi:hypothetical protein
MTDSYRPLFGEDPSTTGLVDGIPRWMMPPVSRWLDGVLLPGGAPHLALIEAFEMRHRINPIDRTPALGAQMRNVALTRPEYGLSLMNFALWYWADSAYSSSSHAVADKLRNILSQGSSVWEVAAIEHEPGRYRLVRRDLAGTREAIEQLSHGERAGDMLRSAWVKIASREPDPSGAYDLAVKAVEAAAHPVIQPAHATATLGTMLGQMRATPNKWSFVLNDIDTVIAMAQTLWGNHYRHGTALRDDHTLEEADAAVHLALSLVRFFTGNAVTTAA